MLIVALVLAVIGLAALVTAVVTSNELIAWVCIGASAIGVLLLIVDAVRERSKGGRADEAETTAETEQFDAEYPDTDADVAADPPPDDAETTVVEQAEENNR
ncbi:DUF308 domain-containing protein [Mycolicibacterium pulveris]|uniref:DUF308 domain-containing protein n=1 Tax=Mycolicibacterium pulveris TaxID=36813 RepID=UPI003CEA0377